MMETSRSPYISSASVRGMGVADMTSRWGARPFWDSLERWPTPKRCCSSVMTSPRSLNSVVSESRAWVPTARSTSPAAKASRTAFFSRSFMEPVSSAVRRPRGAKSLDRDW